MIASFGGFSRVALTAACFLQLLCVSGMAGASEKANSLMPGDKGTTNDTTVITSERLYFDYENRYGILEENVHVVGNGMEINSDKMAMWFRADNQMTNVVATGNVTIKQGGGVATCVTARCDVVTGEMILTGSPELVRGQERMRGEVITIVQEPGRKSVRVKCVGRTSLVLGRGSKLGELKLTGDKEPR